MNAVNAVKHVNQASRIISNSCPFHNVSCQVGCRIMSIGTHSQPICRANPVQQPFQFELFRQTRLQCPVLHECSSKNEKCIYHMWYLIYSNIYKILRPHALMTLARALCDIYIYIYIILIYTHTYIYIYTLFSLSRLVSTKSWAQ